MLRGLLQVPVAEGELSAHVSALIKIKGEISDVEELRESVLRV